jgi:hypothetical protein
MKDRKVQPKEAGLQIVSSYLNENSKLNCSTDNEGIKREDTCGSMVILTLRFILDYPSGPNISAISRLLLKQW